MKLLKSHYRIVLLLTVLILSVTGHLAQPNFLKNIALQLEDGKFSVRETLGFEPEPPEDVIVIAIDEPSINQYGRWPWNRARLGNLIDHFDQASAVGFDMIFSEAAPPEEDKAFATSLQNIDNAILGFFFRGEATEMTDPDALDLLENCAYSQVESQSTQTVLKEYPYSEVNITPLAEAAASCAYFNIIPETDGLYRRYPLGLIYKGNIYPPLAIQALQFHWNKSAEITINEQGIQHFSLAERSIRQSDNLRLNYYSDRAYQGITISAAEVLNGRYEKSFFKNRVVLLGVTEIGVFDVRPTPINIVTPGIYLHATALGNLLEGDILEDSNRAELALIFFSLIAIVAISCLSSIPKRYIGYLSVLLITVLAGWTLLISQLIWIREFYALAGVLLLVTLLEIAAYLSIEKSSKDLKQAFSSYVSPQVIKRIGENPENLQLGGESLEITILFTDIRGFTGISENYKPIQIVQLLNEIHNPLTEIVMQHHGMLDKYIGDAMMVLYNAPLPVDNHADQAVVSALKIIEELKPINKRLGAQGLPAVEIGVGISTGNCIAGNMGSKRRFAYTAIGDPVNLASRLESLCKAYKVPIIISAATKGCLQQDWLLRSLDKVQVSGKEEAVEIYQPLAKTDTNHGLVDAFARAKQDYFARDFHRAHKAFTTLEQEGDKVSGIFAERCATYLKQAPPSNWDGIYIAESK